MPNVVMEMGINVLFDDDGTDETGDLGEEERRQMEKQLLRGVSADAERVWTRVLGSFCGGVCVAESRVWQEEWWMPLPCRQEGTRSSGSPGGAVGDPALRLVQRHKRGDTVKSRFVAPEVACDVHAGTLGLDVVRLVSSVATTRGHAVSLASPRQDCWPQIY